MQSLLYSCWWICLSAIGLYLASLSIVRAEVVTDGTVGPAQTLNGPAFVIPENLGSRAGANLFHSFHQFNIDAGEQATFTGSSSIANVISRVTGGQESAINGLLRSTVGQADFYFINPAGVVFGANAQIDVPASFYVSTADELRFADGSAYSATSPSASSLTFDQPEAFGFLGDQTASISVNQSNFVLTPGSALSLSGNELEIDNARIQIDTGEVQLAAVGTNASMMTVSGNVLESAQGELSIRNSVIDVAGNGAGRIVVRGGESVIHSSELLAENFGDTDAGLDKGIDIRTESLEVDNSFVVTGSFEQGQGADLSVTATGELSVVNGGQIANTIFGPGNAGNVEVNAGQLTVDNQDSEIATAIVSQVFPNSTGDAGDVTVNVKGALSIVNGGQIDSATFGSGNAGNVLVNAGQLTIDGQGSVFGTGITSDTNSDIGKAGSVTVNVANTLSIYDSGRISSNTFSEAAGADAGSVIVNIGELTIDNMGSNFFTGIQSRAVQNTLGKAGNVEVTAKNNISLFGDGRIDTNTFGAGDGGSVLINTDKLLINGPNLDGRASIASTAASGSGNAGSVTVNVKDTLMLTQGAIASATASTGNAGKVTVNARRLIVDGQGEGAGIFTQATSGSTGNAGSITVKVRDRLSIVDTAQISSSTFSMGDAGNVTVEAEHLVIDGNNNLTVTTGILSDALENSSGQAGKVTINVSSLSIIDGARVSIKSDPTIDSATLATIQPTEINITAQDITLTDSTITTESLGNVPAGSITLNVADTLSLDPSTISTAANNADGGPISIKTKVLDLHDSQITTSVTGQGDGGDINLAAEAVVLDSGFIQANTGGANARGGDIQINTDALVASHNRLLRGGDRPLTLQPGLNVIQAAAPEGVSGDIDITSPQLDISGDLIDLDSALLDVDDLVQDPCTTPGGRQSSLSSVGRGGLPESPEQAGSVVVDPERLKRLLPAAKILPGLQLGSVNPVTTDHVGCNPSGEDTHVKIEKRQD